MEMAGPGKLVSSEMGTSLRELHVTPTVSGQIGCFVVMWLTCPMRACAMSLHAEVWHALLADATAMWEAASEKVKDSFEML